MHNIRETRHINYSTLCVKSEDFYLLGILCLSIIHTNVYG